MVLVQGENDYEPFEYKTGAQAKRISVRKRNSDKINRNRGYAYTREELSYRNRKTGQKYIRRKQAVVPAKIGSRKIDCCKKLKCWLKFTDEGVKTLCSVFRSSGKLHDQRHIIAKFCKNVEFRTGYVQTTYFLPSRFSITKQAGQTIQVCRKFLLGALDVSDRFVRYNMAKKIKEGGLVIEPDKRKASSKGRNIMSPITIKSVRNYILLKLETSESHYRRKESKRRYVQKSITISGLYRGWRDNIRAQTSGKKVQVISFESFRRLFRKYFSNVSFANPQNDRCATCLVFKRMSEAMKKKNLETHLLHLREKNAARESKRKAREEAIKQYEELGEKRAFVAAEFDLQKNLEVPCCGFAYYRKYQLRNFTVYDMGKKEATCFVYGETEGGKGSTEVGTCLSKWLLNLEESVVQVVLFSDNTVAQGKNEFLANAFYDSIRAVNKKRLEDWLARRDRGAVEPRPPNLDRIQHNFLIAGHTQMLVDSIHSMIENQARRMFPSITHPDQYIEAMEKAAIHSKPLKIVKLVFSDFRTFKKYTFFNDVKSTSKIASSFKISKFTSFTFKINQRGEYLANSLSARKYYTKAVPDDVSVFGEPIAAGSKPTTDRAYKEQIKIPAEKKFDLLQFIMKGVIPREHLDFYTKLPSHNYEEKKKDATDSLMEGASAASLNKDASKQRTRKSKTDHGKISKKNGSKTSGKGKQAKKRGASSKKGKQAEKPNNDSTKK